MITSNSTQVKLDNMQFEVTGFMDIWAIKEVFINQDYEQFQTVQPNDIVIDVGAGIGDFSIKSSKKSNTTIYAYEADLHRFNVFKRNIKINRSNNITSTH